LTLNWLQGVISQKIELFILPSHSRLFGLQNGRFQTYILTVFFLFSILYKYLAHRCFHNFIILISHGLQNIFTHHVVPAIHNALNFLPKGKGKKGKAIPVTGRGGL
jgi:hypothetical protein